MIARAPSSGRAANLPHTVIARYLTVFAAVGRPSKFRTPSRVK